MLIKFKHSLLNKQENPFYIFDKNKLLEKIKIFKDNFKGKILYAVKANPHKFIIKLLAENGLQSFDAASLNEIYSLRLFSALASFSELHLISPHAASQHGHTITSGGRGRGPFFRSILKCNLETFPIV